MRLELTHVCSLNGFQLVMFYFMNVVLPFSYSVFLLAYFTPHLLLIFDTLCVCVCVCVLVWFQISLVVIFSVCVCKCVSWDFLYIYIYIYI